MLDFTDAGQFAGKLHGKVNFFGLGLQAYAKGSLSFKFGLILLSLSKVIELFVLLDGQSQAGWSGGWSGGWVGGSELENSDRSSFA